MAQNTIFQSIGIYQAFVCVPAEGAQLKYSTSISKRMTAKCEFNSNENPIKKYNSTFCVAIRWVQNGVLYVSYRSSYVITTPEQCKTLADQNLCYSVVKATPRVLLTFLNIEEIDLFIFCLSLPQA